MSSLEVRLLEGLAGTKLADEWQSLISDNPNTGFMQSLPWAEVKRRQGLSQFHLGLFKDNKLIGGSLFYTPSDHNGAGILVAPEGPVLPWQDEPLAREALRLIIDTAQQHAESMGVATMRIEPRLEPPPLRILREFSRAPLDLVPKESLIIDLAQSPELLLDSMKAKGRYNIRLSQRSKVHISEHSSGQALIDPVQRFYSVMLEASARDGFPVEPRRFFETVADVMVPTGHARFLFAEHEGDTLGALLLITCGQRATYLYGGITNHKRNLMAGYALQWAAMLAAQKVGCRSYDLYGFDSHQAPEHRYARFSQFKSRFGGNVIKLIGAQDYFFLDRMTDAFIKIVSETKSLQR